MKHRNRFVFEADDTFAGDPGAAPAAPTAAAEDGAGAVREDAAPVPSGGETPAPSLVDSLEFREAVAAAADSRLQAMLAQYGVGVDDFADDGGQDDTIDPALLDPYSEDFGANLVSTLEQRMQALLDAKLSPFEQWQQQQIAEREQQQADQGKALIEDVLADIQARPDSLGEFEMPESKQQAIQLGEQMFGRYAGAGYPPARAAELALEASYKQVREYENALMSRGEERYKNRLATLADAQGQPGVGAAAVEQTPGEFTSLADLGRQMDLRRRAAI